MDNRISSERLKQLMNLAELRKRKETQDESQSQLLHNAPADLRSSLREEDNNKNFQEATIQIEQTIQQEETKRTPGVARIDLTLNEKQKEAVSRGVKGEDFILIGRAGTGKTTCAGYLARALIEEESIPKQLGRSTKYLNSDSPGVAILSFTNKAVNNIRYAMPEEFKRHTLTIHKILEFGPVRYEVYDEVKGEYVTKMRFEPKRNAFNPLPANLKLLIFEESSMISVELFNQLMAACPHKPQLIFLGDIRQLPPVFGTAILGFKMLELPIVELTEVYRQALKSPILRLALAIDDGRYKDFAPTKVLNGKRNEFPDLLKWNESGEDGIVILHPWQKPISNDHALMTVVKFFEQRHKNKVWNKDEDMILCPFNKSFGTIEINKGIMQFLGEERKERVFEIIAGFNKHYLAVGDRVLYNKEDAVITNIAINTEYLGKRPRPASVNLDRWGHMRHALTEEERKNLKDGEEVAFDVDAVEKFLELAADDVEERVTSASHIVTVKLKYSNDPEDEGVMLEAAAEINNLLGGYAITVHKAQGSEWDNVYLLMHQSHAVMNQRELLYTAITRAKKMLYFLCEPDTICKGIQSQKILGDTLAEKAEWFKGKKEEMDKKLFKGEES